MNIIELKLKSAKLNGFTDVTVLFPAPASGAIPAEYYDRGRKYPVLWLLHGATGDHQTFLHGDRIADIMRGREAIVVMPSALNSDYSNHSEFSSGYAFADYFFDELMPYVYNTFPASSRAEDNYLAGYSMGGSGALMLGLHRGELFGHVGALACSVREAEFLLPYMHLSGEQFRSLAMSEPRRVPTEYGDPDKGITLKEINMIARYPDIYSYVHSMECTWERFRELAHSGTLPEILFCCGTNDGCFEKVEKVRA